MTMTFGEAAQVMKSRQESSKPEAFETCWEELWARDRHTESAREGRTAPFEVTLHISSPSWAAGAKDHLETRGRKLRGIILVQTDSKFA